MSRPLTQGEISITRDIFKDSLDLSRVRIHARKFIFFQPDDSGMTPNGQIYVHGTYSGDYANEDALRKAFFIHEMVHVWQHQTGVLALGVIGSAIVEMIRRAGNYDAAYPYALDPAKDLKHYGLEQQASLIEDYFRLTRLGLQPRRALSPVAPERALYEQVLHRFLSEPTYGRRPRRVRANGE
jgi:type VI secretion system secreted protein VgrG